jgi:hypothetical protein
MATFDTTFTASFEDDEAVVELSLSYDVENDGIGGYEYWGSKEYDRGEDCANVYEISWDKSLYTDEQNTAISEQVEKYTSDFEKEIEQSWTEY